jgi:hypothetical protein
MLWSAAGRKAECRNSSVDPLAGFLNAFPVTLRHERKPIENRFRGEAPKSFDQPVPLDDMPEKVIVPFSFAILRRALRTLPLCVFRPLQRGGEVSQSLNSFPDFRAYLPVPVV